jgi:hypothetical protein
LSRWTFDSGHPNFQGPADATVSGTRHAFAAATYAQLQAVKAKYDHYNNFRVNHNIPPAGSI